MATRPWLPDPTWAIDEVRVQPRRTSAPVGSEISFAWVS